MKTFGAIVAALVLAVAGCSKSGTQTCEKMCQNYASCTGSNVEQCQMQYNCVELDQIQGECSSDQINPYIDCLDNCASASCDSVQKCLAGCTAPACVM